LLVFSGAGVRTNTCPVFAIGHAELAELAKILGGQLRTHTCPV
jgi:hypothetical protein